MAKIGTAHVEIKPVLSEEALDAMVSRIADAVAEGVERALANREPKFRVSEVSFGSLGTGTYREVVRDEVDRHARLEARD